MKMSTLREWCATDGDQLPSLMKVFNSSSISPMFLVSHFREMERLALIAAERLNKLRRKLHNYSSGDFWVAQEGLTRKLRHYALGKSTHVNFTYSVFSRSRLFLFAKKLSGAFSDSTIMYMEERNVLRSMQSGFCVKDSTGLIMIN